MNKGEKAVRYMRKMATGCRWRVLREIRYQKTDGSEVILIPDVWYIGIPYTQGKKKRRYHLLRFKMNLFGGIFYYRKSLVGNDCSSAASYAWKRVNRDMPVLSTKKILQDLCGKQTYFTHRDAYTIPYDAEGTDVIINQNCKSDIINAYKTMKVGDGFLQYDSITKKGHIMLLSKEIRDDTAFIIDQKGFGPGSSEKDDTSWRLDFPFSFDELIQEGYVPVFLTI